MLHIVRSEMLLVLVASVLVTGVASNCIPRCQNGGQCHQGTCLCRANFTGTHCQIDRRASNPCYLVSCKNGGTCVQLGLGYVCSCLDGYSGSHCENVDSWYSNTPPASTSTSDIYNPLGVLLGVVLSLVALAAVLGLLSWWKINRRQQQLRYPTRHGLGNHGINQARRNSRQSLRLSSTSDSVVTSVSEGVQRGPDYGLTYAPYDSTLFLPPAYSLAVNDPKYCGDDNPQGPPPSYEETMTLTPESAGGDAANSETRPPVPQPPDGCSDTASSADQTGEISS